MNIETFPSASAQPVWRPVQDEQRYVSTGEAWELRLVAEAYDMLGPSSLIVSDALAFLADRLIRGAEVGSFVLLIDDRCDHSEVFLVDHLLDDLREGCALLFHAVAHDQFSAHPRILHSTAELVRRTCRRICRSC